METLIWIGVPVFLLMAVAGALQVMYLDRQFRRYLKQQHYQKWKDIYDDQIIKKSLLWPFMKNTPVDFLWTSKEDFGDPSVTEFKRRIRRAVLAVIAAGIAAVVWFVTAALILESRRP